ncbi:hypothetical protein OAF63_01320 [Saprospiraceae bacterium]|jgi:hypothetical protein|nr:hypothetical protein [Bacteroidota bacterium]MDB4727403.1 hypothetical protein [Saprospiraceae bacterium]MDF1866178.1 hypothetical protein [Saprospiraceae bacterium]
MSSKNYLFTFFLLTIFIWACTPKVPEVITEKEPKEEESHPAAEPKVDENLSPCPKFSDAPNPDQVIEDYVLYRDFMKAKDWDGAFEKWKKVYEVAPAADGQRNTVFADGIKFYEHFIIETKDSVEKAQYVDKIFEIYDEIDKCYPQGGYVDGRKAFDYFYKYPNLSTKEKTFNLFKQSIDKDGEDAQYFVLNPFTGLLIDMHYEEKISTEDAKKYQQILRKRLAKGLAECKGRECENWKIIEEYLPARLEGFESVKGFYDCDYYVDKYYPEFEENPEDEETIQTVYSRLRFGGCSEESTQIQTLRQAYIDCCYKPNTPCRDALTDSRYTEAIECYEAKASEETDPIKRGEHYLLIAKIYHSHLKNFSKARQYALKAAKEKPNWGDPYLLIGRLYASSGPLCGSGRGWNSQVVVWTAVDMWNKAKNVDPNARAEANKWIGRYSQYMPEKSEIFQRGLKEGGTYFVPCWIQRTTKIRAKS